MLAGHDIVFLALPHGQSGQYTDALQDTPLVIDAGADHRLESVADWDRFYGGDFHDPWTYGVPELLVAGSKQRERLVGATRIAAPGCNASTVSLSLAPGSRRASSTRRDIVTVLAVGPSGAGKSLQAEPARERDPRLGEPVCRRRHAPAHPRDPPGARRRRTASRRRDAADSRRRSAHGAPTPEWLTAQAPTKASGSPSRPILVPMARGILATSTAPIAPGATDDDIRGAWEAAYGDETFVQLLPAGEFPRTADVLGANTALMGLAIDRAANRVVVVTAVDNLVKGTAGAAIQSMNIALGLAEGTALTVDAGRP